MNKLNKIGLTALAGSLAAITGVQAGSIAVNGGANITYHKAGSTSSSAQSDTGNPLGWSNNLTLVGTGELDNGISWTMNAYQSDAQSFTSSNITFDLGGMGSLLVDNGAGGAGLDALDDKTPSAWEESWDAGMDSGVDLVSGVHGSASLTWTSPADILPMGTKLRLAYTPRADGGGLQSDKGSSAAAGTGSNTDGTDITIEMAPVDGLTAYIGYSEIGIDNKTTNATQEKLEGIYGFTYAMGPVTVGAAKSYESNDTGATTTVNYYENENWSIAFNVNDNLSVSYAEFSSEEHLGTTGGQTLEIDSIQIAYNLGGATLKIAESEADDAKYAANANATATTVALSLAF